MAPFWIQHEAAFGTVLILAFSVVKIKSRRVADPYVENVANLCAYLREIELVDAGASWREIVIADHDHGWILGPRLAEFGEVLPLSTETVS